jgi:hypothetical protein
MMSLGVEVEGLLLECAHLVQAGNESLTSALALLSRCQQRRLAELLRQP